MQTGKKPTNRSDARYRTDMLSLITFALTLYSGVLLQIVYHMGHHQAEYAILGLDRAGWLNVHLAGMALTMMAIGVHLSFNAGSLKALFVANNYIRRSARTRVTFWLGVIFCATALTGITAWPMQESPASRMLIEIHDKLGPVLIVLAVIHIWQHGSWIKKKTYEMLGR